MNEKHTSIVLSDLSRLNEREIKIEWSKEWWDGPLNGLATFEGRKRWFEFHSDDEDGRHYYYVLYPLSVEGLRCVEAWRAANEEWQVKWTERYSRDGKAMTEEAK